ncbi:hypothetical protein DICPUDRAFT_83267 [Dictyostelium purpureum]|uniref:DH domain-containing protein n=1 Tax=Dictyostelium purpureum TaxID=5786 RepID=F0ZZ18_DICPU|nr:uncharacterized protein DICPUDRAFT_83267 [Dictyostelium purpureum]EGC30814.1 hypothetical protein DICPUDRAFT_83267 [Dictyostelium purpureum]|eukprot:XP_003292657.1 hypothetical protein DICPUDRAFT_83267 [Dictyostelium purpureum]
MDDYSLRLFPGLSHRPPPRSASITYVNGVPVQVNGNDLVRAHPIPATYPPKGRMTVPPPPGYVPVFQPNETVTWDPVIGQYRREQQQREQQQREQQQREQQQREQQQREQQQREQQQREQQQREHQRQQQIEHQRQQQQREQQQREQQQREQQQREQQQRQQQIEQQRQQQRQQQQIELQRQKEEQQRRQLEEQKRQREQKYNFEQTQNNINGSGSTLIKSNSFHSIKQEPVTTQGQQPFQKQRKNLEPLDPPAEIKHSTPTPSQTPQQKQESIKETKNISKEYPIEKKLNDLSIKGDKNKETITSEAELNQRKRMKSLNELLSTEESYSDSLEKLLLYYKLPLESKLNTKEMSSINQSDVNALFSNVEALLVISKDLLLKLKYEFSLPENEQKIGDLYIEKSKEMKLYVAYINNYELAMEELKKIEETSPKFFKDCQSKYKYSLDIRSLLIMPVQRIPRYELLFREILKYTNQNSPEYQKLLEAHQSIHKINDYINNNKKLRENKDRVVTIAKELKGCPDSLFKSSRRWIKEGILDITCSSKKYNGQFNVYLFNDLIVLGKHKTFRSKIIEYFAEINLDNSEFKEIPGSPTKFRFISDPEGKKPLIFTFEAENEKIKDSWIKNLKLLDEERKLSNVIPTKK